MNVPPDTSESSGESNRPGFAPGEIVSDRYRIDSFLARGGMGEVYRAWDSELALQVALKTIRAEIASEPSALRRFKQEILLARSVSHPNVCRIFDLGRHRDATREVVFLTMEFLDGVTLAEGLRTRTRFSVDETLPLARQLADALDAAHRAGIVHRDFKSLNVMLVPATDGVRAVITDFGLARAARSGGASEGRSHVRLESPSADEATMDLTREVLGDPRGDVRERVDAVESASAARAEEVVGTPAYMAPEQLLGEPVGPAADLYSFGIVLFEMTTGQVPFRGRTPMETAAARLSQDPPPPSSRCEIPPHWDAAILRLLARQPADRFRCATDAVRSLEGHIAVEGGARHSLLAERDAFVGRREEIRRLERALEPEPALVTLLGTGGMGKTRLARSYGWQNLERWPGGVWFCDLTEARDLDGIALAVATGLDVALTKGDPIQQLGHAIAGRGRALVILDNFEQVSAFGETALGAWIARAREASFLVTSRERLQIDSEVVLDLDPLAPEAEGVELFAERAKVHRPDLELPSNRALLEEIVRWVDGLPLAIELAAARLRTLSLEQLRERLADRFQVLTGPKRGRQSTLRATLDWSWELLLPAEQSAVVQSSVFEGGFTLEAAEAVLDLSLWGEATSVLDVVQALVDKSWLRTRVAHGTLRFGMLSSLQEYARERLRSHAVGLEEEVLARRHGEYYARFGTRESIAALSGPGGVQKRHALRGELENAIAACRRALGRGDGGMAALTFAAAWAVLRLRGPLATAIDLGRSVLPAAASDSRARSRVLAYLGEAFWLGGRVEEARESYEAALALDIEQHDRVGQGQIESELGLLHREQGRLDTARDHFERSLAIHREIGNRGGEGGALGHLGVLHWQQGLMDVAREQLEACLAIQREVGNRRDEGGVLGHLGTLLGTQGKLEESRALFEEAVRIMREVGDRRGEGIYLANLGSVHVALGRADLAVGHNEEALAIHREVGNRVSEGLVLGNLGNLLRTLGKIPEARERCEAALEIHREGGHRRFEGITLGNLGSLELAEGDLDRARELLALSESRLREVGDRLELGRTLCALGLCAFRSKDSNAAETALAEAETLALMAGAGPASQLGRDLAGLRERIVELRGESDGRDT